MLAFVGVAVIRALLSGQAARSGAWDGFGRGMLLLAIGLAIAGAVGGAAWPLRRTLSGQLLVGGVAGLSISGAIVFEVNPSVAQWDSSTFRNLAIVGIVVATSIIWGMHTSRT